MKSGFRTRIASALLVAVGATLLPLGIAAAPSGAAIENWRPTIWGCEAEGNTISLNWRGPGFDGDVRIGPDADYFDVSAKPVDGGTTKTIRVQNTADASLVGLAWSTSYLVSLTAVNTAEALSATTTCDATTGMQNPPASWDLDITECRVDGTDLLVDWTVPDVPEAQGFTLSVRNRDDVLAVEFLPGGFRSFGLEDVPTDAELQVELTAYSLGDDFMSIATCNAATYDVAPFATADDFINRQYRDFLGRAPWAGEAAKWRTALVTGTSPDQLAASLVRGTQSDNEAKVIRLYFAYRLALPSNADVTKWTAALNNGTSTITSLASSFAKHTSYTSRIAQLSNTAFVDHTFKSVINRTPTASERTFWMGELAKSNRATITRRVSQSAPAITAQGRTVDTYRIYRAMLHRVPTNAERKGVSGADTAARRKATVAFVRGTDEYADLIG